MSLEIGSLWSDTEADRYCCIAAIGFDGTYHEREAVILDAHPVRVRSGRFLSARLPQARSRLARRR